MLAGKRIMVGVLNWGLGHASRSVQLIRQLEELNAAVTIASDGQALEFLKGEFPNARIFQLPELDVHYASAFGLQWSLIGQLPKLIQSLKAEKKALDTFLNDQPIDFIISDNRYGLYHESIPSVLLSHQLSLQLKFAKAKADSFMRNLMENFNEIWVPDEEGVLLSGRLSQLDDLPISRYYMGTMSHLSNMDVSQLVSASKASYLAILSGPEPLRSHFEKQLAQAAERQQVPLLIIRGTMQSNAKVPGSEYVEFKDRLSTSEIIEAAQNHLGVIARSGYSTLMDLSWLKLPALVVPTPGQTEQVYLASYHAKAKHFYSQREKKLDLKRDLEEAFGGAYGPPKLEVGLKVQRSLMIERFNELLN